MQWVSYVYGFNSSIQFIDFNYNQTNKHKQKTKTNKKEFIIKEIKPGKLKLQNNDC